MMDNGVANGLILLGAAAVVIGLLAKFGLMEWFGHLPGDIRIRGEHGAFYFPITTMILLSVVISGILQLLKRF